MDEEKFTQIINKAFQEQTDHFDKKFEGVENRLTSVEDRMHELDEIKEGLIVVKKKIDDTYNLLDHFAGDYKRIDEEQVALGARVGQLEGRVEQLEVAMA